MFFDLWGMATMEKAAMRFWLVQWFHLANAMTAWWLPPLMVYYEHPPQD